jgi:hypothetical protein
VDGDGHTEHRKWRIPKVVTVKSAPQMVPDGGLPDYREFRKGFEQDLD